MTVFFQQLLNGVVIGSTLALLALGFTLVFGILRVLNMAHPAIFVWGGFITLVCAKAGINPLLSLLLATATGAAWGLVLDRLLLRWMRKSEMATPFIATIGVTLFMENLAVKIWGPEPLGVPSALPVGARSIFGLHISNAQLVTLASTAVALLLFWLLVEKTWFGLGVRATSENAEVAGAVGINTERVMTSTVVVASGFAGLTGFLFVGLYGQVFAYMGDGLGLQALVIMMIGGLGNLLGAVVAGLLLGILQALAIGYVSAGWSTGIAFMALFVVLVIFPQGLFAQRVRTR